LWETPTRTADSATVDAIMECSRPTILLSQYLKDSGAGRDDVPRLVAAGVGLTTAVLLAGCGGYPDDHGVEALPQQVSGYDTGCLVDALAASPLPRVSDEFRVRLPDADSDLHASSDAFVVEADRAIYEAFIADGSVWYWTGFPPHTSSGPSVGHCLTGRTSS
jgi:hypothetical protein